MPKPVRIPPPKPVDKGWSCLFCGESLKTVFDGETVAFTHLGRMFAACGGLYESATVKCPKCGEWIEFRREELEKPEEA